jgi:ribosomal protein L37AE/L43A
MQTKFKLKELFNNGDLKICREAYKQANAYRMGVSDIHHQQDYVYTCPKCKDTNQLSYTKYVDYVMFVHDCYKCGERVFVSKHNTQST